MAKLAEQAKRYEEMVEFMEKVSSFVENEKQTVEERVQPPLRRLQERDQCALRLLTHHLLN
ncbi:hypothetical protein JHK82_044861 [Glycine max]|nr:hypothetical protein JHK86_045268 [Glycine max]KAG4951983.1 hypothetical protein JHK85_045850 [Glycine max]KAG5099809.1 hypothetical protein JHK82_044861 [Glycine max]